MNTVQKQPLPSRSENLLGLGTYLGGLNANGFVCGSRLSSGIGTKLGEGSVVVVNCLVSSLRIRLE